MPAAQSRPSKFANKTVHSKGDWAAIEKAYKTSHDSTYLLAERFGASEATIRRKAKQFGWVRCASEDKRQVVSDALAGVTPGLTPDALRHAQAMEAATDILDMRTGIKVFRNLLVAMDKASETLIKEGNWPDPRDAKTIAEATEKAISGIRTIRGLNPEPPAPPTQDVDLSRFSLEDLKTMDEILTKAETDAAPVE